jgi:hypothetical protein
LNNFVLPLELFTTFRINVQPLELSKTNTALADAVDRVIILYDLSKDE